LSILYKGIGGPGRGASMTSQQVDEENGNKS